MYDVLTVADAILKIAKGKGQMLTPMQLVKLTYIAHGWSLALRGKGLFRNQIEAWQYGPVIPDLYHVTKCYGRNPIPFTDIGDVDDVRLASEDAQFVEQVFQRYGHFDGIKLSYLTHKPNTPWTKVYDKWSSMPIPDELIAQHYRDLAYEHRQQS